MKTQLVEGKIPAHTKCPFHDLCGDGNSGACIHKGIFHQVAFSCGFARAFDLMEREECKCNLRTKLVGDGCEVCNPEYAEAHEG